MSNRIFQAVWDHGPKARSEMLVLMVLADSADAETGECFPSLRRIAHGARMSVRTARDALRSLEIEGWIKTGTRLRGNQSQTSSLYTVQIEKLGLTPIKTGAAETAAPPGRNCRPPRQKLPGAAPAETAAPEQTILTKGACDARAPQTVPLDLFDQWRASPGVPGQTKQTWAEYQADYWAEKKGASYVD